MNLHLLKFWNPAFQQSATFSCVQCEPCESQLYFNEAGGCFIAHFSAVVPFFPSVFFNMPSQMKAEFPLPCWFRVWIWKTYGRVKCHFTAAIVCLVISSARDAHMGMASTVTDFCSCKKGALAPHEEVVATNTSVKLSANKTQAFSWHSYPEMLSGRISEYHTKTFHGC